MKQIGVSVDDETDGRVSNMADQVFFTELGETAEEHVRLKRLERELREQITSFRASDRLSRDDVHERDVG